MYPNPVNFGRAIQEAMSQVRAARIHPDSVEAVDETLRILREEAEEMKVGEDDPVVSALREAEAAFHTGDTAQAIQRLSAALIRVTRSEP